MNKNEIAFRSIAGLTTLVESAVGAKRLNPVRAFGYQLRNGIPREFNVTRGSKVVQVGMWRLPNALRLAKAIGFEGQGLIVEASEEYATKIEDEFRSRGYSHMSVVHAAGWFEDAELTMNESDEPSGNQVDGVELAIPKDFTGRSFVVPGRRIDGLASEHGVLDADYVEVTVNGAEVDVLNGMPEVLGKANRILVAGMMRDSSGRPAHHVVEPILQEHGFRTQVSKEGTVVTEDWGKVDGHVFGYRA